jgi:hypothetical protein
MYITNIIVIIDQTSNIQDGHNIQIISYTYYYAEYHKDINLYI